MEWYTCLALCFLSFAAGFCFCGLLSIAKVEMPDPPEHVAGVGVRNRGC